jgi:hypothetical protein
MKTNWLKIAAAVALACTATTLAGCSAGDMEDFDGDYGEDGSEMGEEMELGQLEQGLMSCTNVDGTNAVMAALAVSAAKELKRWQPSKDFVVFTTSGWSEASPGMQQAIKLTATGKAQCAGGNCWNTQALLNLQYDQANNLVKFPGNVTLSPGALRSRLVAKLREQQTCESRPVNGGNSNCPVEEHKLAFTRSEKGGCDTNFFFKATTPTGTALRYPAQLKNKLIWVDQYNPYVAFQSVGDVISIDPTYGLNEEGTTTSGTCSAACTKISSNVATAGQCCTCNSATRKYAKSAWSTTTFLCNG